VPADPGTVTGHDRPVALVTGASRGIGRCAALALARAGCDVVITARTVHEGDGRTDDASGPVSLPGSLDTTAAEVTATGASVHAVAMDLLDRVSVENMAAAATAKWGRLDVLVNNAIYQGPGPMQRIDELTIDEAEKTIRADYLHQLLLIQRVLPVMLSGGGGSIINMSSGTAYLDPPGPTGQGGWGVAYAAAKAAVTRLAPILHAEYGGLGVRAFNVDPGFVVNERMRATSGAGQFTDAGFRGVPAEVPGAVIAWLATDDGADQYMGTLVHAQKVCRDRGLVDGWPPPKA
jgi:NAD(P)-dependent dehydrogenase (short-subunit alcohol dehydrogenase family)